MSETNRILKAIVYWMLMLIFAMTVLVFFYLAPKIDAILFPAVTDFKITRIETAQDGKSAEVWGVLNKQRGYCRKKELNVFSDPIGSGKTKKNYGFVSLEDMDVPNRPEGVQEFGPWKIIRPEDPLGPLIHFSATHSCNFMWETVTDLGSYVTTDIFPNAKQEIDQ